MKHLQAHLLLFILLACFSLFLLAACKSTPDEPAIKMDLTPYELVLPPSFPPPQIPNDNQLTIARVALGKKLFFDPLLSRDSTIACGSCHFQAFAFTDNRPISIGIEDRVGFRNSATLTNIAYQDLLFKDGGVPSLALQVLAPLEDATEMDFNILDVAERLNAHPTYPDLFTKAYDRVPDPYTITRAIASFERTLISGNSPYDQYTHQSNLSALSQSAINGMFIFNSETTKCANCHSGFNFSDQQFYNNGLYEDYADLGRRRVTLLEEDIGKFKVPTLRNIALTAPYMHDGSLENLEAVIVHYMEGGSNHPNKSPLLQGFELSPTEQQDLLHFLEALTDTSFINNPAFLPE